MEALLRIAQRCFLGLLPETDLKALLVEGGRQTHESGETVAREDAPNALFLVVEGEIRKVDPENSDEDGDIARPGGLLEPEAVFQGASQWTRTWVAGTRATLLKLEFQRVRTAL